MPARTTFSQSGDPVLDALLAAVIERCEGRFPGRVLAYYLVGSRLGEQLVSTSDLDIDLIFRDAVSPSDEAALEQLMESCSRLSPVQVDLTAAGARELMDDSDTAMIPRITLKHGGRLLAGEDMLDRITMPPFDSYLRWVARAPIVNFGKMLRQVTVLAYPLEFPDPNGEFFGYDVRRTTNRYTSDGRGTKELVASLCWTATARLALDAGQVAGSRPDSVRLYRESIGDDWTGLIETAYARCRDAWAYRLPASPTDRALLRDLCRRTLDFENDYLQRYRRYLLSELRHGDDRARASAVHRLTEVRYPDAQTAAALSAALNDNSPLVRTAAAAAQPAFAATLS